MYDCLRALFSGWSQCLVNLEHYTLVCLSMRECYGLAGLSILEHSSLVGPSILECYFQAPWGATLSWSKCYGQVGLSILECYLRAVDCSSRLIKLLWMLTTPGLVEADSCVLWFKCLGNMIPESWASWSIALLWGWFSIGFGVSWSAPWLSRCLETLLPH